MTELTVRVIADVVKVNNPRQVADSEETSLVTDASVESGWMVVVLSNAVLAVSAVCVPAERWRVMEDASVYLLSYPLPIFSQGRSDQPHVDGSEVREEGETYSSVLLPSDGV